MTMKRYTSWGFANAPDQQAKTPNWSTDLSAELALSAEASRSMLGFGRGRSYGDSCLNSHGVLLDSNFLNQFIAFDKSTGVLTAQPGITLADIARVSIPAGWFLAVSPGTSFVTLGGAIANDVHGKNHHADGCFGNFVLSLKLARSDGCVLSCSPIENAELFGATIGGLGLTGFIAEATIQLIPINSANMDVHYIRFHGLDEFAALSREHKRDSRYTVAWLDCASSGKKFARGVFMAANHANNGELCAAESQTKLTMPVALPSMALNTYSVRAFNSLYFWRHQRVHQTVQRQYYQSFFYPLDAIGQWNKIYGAKGFHQYQFVVPVSAMASLEHILRDIVSSGMGSFLAVLKEFGDIVSPGMLSFPREGYCLALDFANRGVKTEQLIARLDAQVVEAGGAAYPAKDRLMSESAFKVYYPAYDSFSEHIDPHFDSDFWHRVSGGHRL